MDECKKWDCFICEPDQLKLSCHSFAHISLPLQWWSKLFLYAFFMTTFFLSLLRVQKWFYRWRNGRVCFISTLFTHPVSLPPSLSLSLSLPPSLSFSFVLDILWVKLHWVWLARMFCMGDHTHVDTHTNTHTHTRTHTRTQSLYLPNFSRPV